MKLVGATDTFIRRPFLVEGMAQGMVAGVIACLLIWPLYGFFLRAVPQAPGWPGGTPLFVMLLVFAVGIGLGWLGSWVAVRRFIKHVHVS
jgi:cell division transport system permease protein